jgi:hypothetical protein
MNAHRRHCTSVRRRARCSLHSVGPFSTHPRSNPSLGRLGLRDVIQISGLLPKHETDPHE